MMAVALSCAAPRRTRNLGALEAQYLLHRREHERAQTSTLAYRTILARSLSSQCRMFPSDSQLYDLRAADCGAAPAAVMGISRLLLEVSATPRFLPGLIVDRRVRWFDLPPAGACGP
jgi:hypothetical protein